MNAPSRHSHETRDLPALVGRARRAWNRALAVALLGSWLGLALATAALVVLTGRVLGTDPVLPAMIAAVLAALVLAARAHAARRVDDRQMAALLDLRLSGDGRLLHALEHGRSLDRMHALDTLTRPRPDARRLATRLLPGAAFLGLTLLIPVRTPEPLPHERLAEQRLAELAELAAGLDEVLELEEELHAELHENLASAEEGLAERELTGAALHEALDGLEQRLSDRAHQAADELSATRTELARAGEALDAGADLTDLRGGLDALAAELADLGALPDGVTLPDLQDLATDELLARLDAGAAEVLRELAEGGLLDARRLNDARRLADAARRPGDLRPLPPLADRDGGDEACEGGQCDGEGGQCAAHGGSVCGACEAAATSPDGSGFCPTHGFVAGAPGRGGVTRGRADAPLTWGQPTPDLAAEMTPGTLPPPASVDEAMTLLGLARTAPTADPRAEGVATGAPAPGVSGEAVHQRRLHPRHRRAVSGFFDGDGAR